MQRFCQTDLPGPFGSKHLNLPQKLSQLTTVLYDRYTLISNPEEKGLDSPDPSLNPGEKGLDSPDPSLNPGEKGLNSPDPTLNPGEKGLNLPDPTLNPGEMGLNSPDLMLLWETQAPNLLVTLHQEEPGTGSDQIAKLNPCAGPKLHETSIHPRFQDQSTMFDVEKLSKLVKKFAADVDTHLPSTRYTLTSNHPGISTKSRSTSKSRLDPNKNCVLEIRVM